MQNKKIYYIIHLERGEFFMKIDRFRCDLIGLSSEDKPEYATSGTTFYEVDTQKLYIMYEGTWYLQGEEESDEGGEGGDDNSDEGGDDNPVEGEGGDSRWVNVSLGF